MSLRDDQLNNYLISIRDNNSDFHKMNYEFINYFVTTFQKNNFVINNDEINYHGNPNFIQTLNFYLKRDLYTADTATIISYHIMSYLMKKKMGYDLEMMMKENNILNIIAWRIIDICYHCKKKRKNNIYEGSEAEDSSLATKRMIKDKLNYFQKLFEQIVDNLFIDNEPKYNNKCNQDKTTFKDEMSVIFNQLFSTTYKMYANYRLTVVDNPIDYAELERISKEAIEEHIVKQEAIENAELIAFEEPKVIDKTEEYYNTLATTLKPYIDRGTPENYKLIVDYRSFNGNQNKYLSSKKITLKEWVLFAKTFELNRNELISLVKYKEKQNSLTKDNTYFNVQEINLFYKQATPFEQALIKVRNECLNKIDPTRFPLYEVV